MSTEQANKRIADLEAALLAAIDVIQQWHDADAVWGIYFNHAPEMKLIREAIKNIPTT